MAMKGAIKEGSFSTNSFELLVLGMPPLTPITTSGLEEEIVLTELPDKTNSSSGVTNPSTITIEFPLHHTTEILALEAWLIEAKTRLPTYKKAASLVYKDPTGLVLKTFTLNGMWPSKFTYPDLDMGGDGEMARLGVDFSVDEILPI